MTGTAELCAEEICLALKGADRKASMIFMDDLEIDIFDPTFAYIICTSTYGHGDVPDNAKKLYEALHETRPNLKGIKYGIFALGDITHGETFCWGALKFDKILSDLQATRIGEVIKHDATSGELPEDMAGEWAVKWAQILDT